MEFAHELHFVALEISSCLYFYWQFMCFSFLTQKCFISDADGCCIRKFHVSIYLSACYEGSFQHIPRSLGYKDLLLALLIYFKMFLIAMMVWECPVIVIIDLFVLSSHTVALKVHGLDDSGGVMKVVATKILLDENI